MLVCAFLHSFAHETAGAARTRSSLRPSVFRGGTIQQTSGAASREKAASYSIVIARLAASAEASLRVPRMTVAVLPIVQHFSLKSLTGQNWPLKRSGRAMLDRSIADEVEAAIRAGSAEKHL